MAVRFGTPKEHESELTLQDVLAHPIWVTRHDLSRTNPAWEHIFAVVNTDDVTPELLARKYDPLILCRVHGRKLFARATYYDKERHLMGIYFWQRGRWIELGEIALPRPLTLVAVPKIKGQSDVPFYLLTKKDRAAPGAGGQLLRVGAWGFGGSRAVLSKTLDKIVPLTDDRKWKRYVASQKAARASKGKAIRLGQPQKLSTLTLRDCLRHPIWVRADEATYGEDYQQPVLRPRADITRELLDTHGDPVVTCTFEDRNVAGTAYYSHKDGALYGITIWQHGKWVDVCTLKGLRLPVVLTPTPKVLAERKVRFILTSRSGQARRSKA